MTGFAPWPSLVPGLAASETRAVVVIPARDEASALPGCLEALAGQRDLDGTPLNLSHFELLLFLNNCTDESASVARTWGERHPGVRLHIAERSLAAAEAHVGTARRWLMDTGWHRLGEHLRFGAILSTDADTSVAPDWIATNLRALENGADVVGGSVHLRAEEHASLPPALRHRYEQDRHYARCIAELEAALDPQPGDPVPRHLDHFGSSLACTASAYAAAGGLPAVTPLEDEAFVDRVRAAGLRLRHEPAVRVFTSARLRGRAPVGLAGLLQSWADLPSDEAHVVPSAAFIEHRFRTLAQLRHLFETKAVGSFPLPTEWWRDTFKQALAEQASYPRFLSAVFCDVLIRESFHGQEQETIFEAIASLTGTLASLGNSSAQHLEKK